MRAILVVTNSRERAIPAGGVRRKRHAQQRDQAPIAQKATLLARFITEKRCGRSGPLSARRT